jgi:ADP-ribose pyrophosphatase YjhB (NUDIX family)
MEILSPDQALRYCARCGAARLQIESARLVLCPVCRFRHHINPISAAAVILADVAGDLLLVRRARDPGKDKLGLPGGFIDLEETAEGALRREVREETGLEIEAVAYLASFPNRYVYQDIAVPVLDLFFTGQVRSFAAARPLTEVRALEIVAPDELDLGQLAFPSNARALALYCAQHRR